MKIDKALKYLENVRENSFCDGSNQEAILVEGFIMHMIKILQILGAEDK